MATPADSAVADLYFTPVLSPLTTAIASNPGDRFARKIALGQIDFDTVDNKQLVIENGSVSLLNLTTISCPGQRWP